MASRLCNFLVVSMIIAQSSGAGAQESQPDPLVIELRQTIAELVDTQSLVSKEKSDWAARKGEMEALLDLHRRELALLDEELAKSGQSADGYDDEKKSAEAEVQALREVRGAASEAVVRNRPRILSLMRFFPLPLATETEVERVNLESWKAGDEPREALQAILAVVSKAEQFNRRVTRVREVREGREVETLYLGLAIAYYADRLNHAGIGKPGPEGWVWSSRPELRTEVLKAFDTLDKKRPPSLVELPVQIN